MLHTVVVLSSILQQASQPSWTELANALVPIIIAVIASILAGGALFAGVMLLIVRMVLKSEVVISTMQSAFLGLPPEWQETVDAIVELMSKIAEANDKPPSELTLKK